MPFAHPVKRSLLLVAQPEYLATDDLLLIRDNIRARAPDITVLVVGRGDNPRLINPALWTNPVLTVGFGPLGNFKPLRGEVYWNRAIPKIDQYELMVRAGISTPKTAPFTFGMDLPQEEWGEFSVLKPAALDVTSSGRGLFLYRSRRLAALSSADLPPDHFALHNPMLVQAFVDTGPQFSVYRCLTLFGEVIYQNIIADPDAHPSLDSEDQVIESMHPEPPRLRSSAQIDADPEIMSFGASVHRAFPGIPLLGCDILREHSTGRIFAIEVNAGGNVWHLSSPRTRESRSITKVQQYLQTFQSYEKAALALIRATRRHAL